MAQEPREISVITEQLQSPESIKDQRRLLSEMQLHGLTPSEMGLNYGERWQPMASVLKEWSAINRHIHMVMDGLTHAQVDALIHLIAPPPQMQSPYDILEEKQD